MSRRPSEGRGNWNRAGRKSGGDRPFKLGVGNVSFPTVPPDPHLSIQCFERRHGDCHGHDTMFNMACGCGCHSATDRTGRTDAA